MNMNSDEEVQLAIQRHPWYFFRPFLWSLIPFITILITFYFSGASGITGTVLIIGILVIFYFWLQAWVCWSKTIYLLTNQRIIVVEQEGWFTREISESTLENILFISHKVSGPVKTILNMGSIHIRTSGVVEEEIVLRDVVNPYEIQKKIVEIQRKYSKTEATIKVEEKTQKDFLEKEDGKEEKKKTILR